MYIFLQQYWWLIVSLLGAILVFLLFVQGGNSLLFCLGKTEEHRKMLVNSTGRKWEFTFTTLVTFGGAFFASNQIALFVIAIIQIMLPFCCHSGHSWRKSLGMTGLFPGCNHSHSMVPGGLEVMS